MLFRSAQLKLQITELELASFGRDRTGTARELAPSIDHVWPSMPTYDAGSHISIGAGVMTFGFHFPEVGQDGTVQRWSGPSTHSGLVALIERSKPLFAGLSSVTFIDPSVEITRVRVDGEEAQFAWTADKSLKFLIPPIEESRGPMATQLAFAVNKCLVVQDVQPQYADNRSVGFCTFGLKLSADAS